MVWLAMYDDDMLLNNFKQKIGYCKNNLIPSEFASYVLDQMQAFLIGKKCIQIRRSDSFVLTRMYLVTID